MSSLLGLICRMAFKQTVNSWNCEPTNASHRQVEVHILFIRPYSPPQTQTTTVEHSHPHQTTPSSHLLTNCYKQNNLPNKRCQYQANQIGKNEKKWAELGIEPRTSYSLVKTQSKNSATELPSRLLISFGKCNILY